jgi:galactokinase
MFDCKVTRKMIDARNLPERFGTSKSAAKPRIFRAPGRVNLIGEHTDYNQGFVMPAAIDFFTWVAILPRADRVLAAFSENFQEQVEFDLDDPAPQARGHWADYVRGVAVTLEQAGYQLKGAQLQIKGEVPIGAGLSSSAALEVATARALLENSELTIEPVRLAQLCQRAENEFVGLGCGIMDQFVSCLGQKRKALMLDCRSLDYRALSLPADTCLVVCNTMIKHELAAGDYNRRRTECDIAVRHLARQLPGVQSLRDVAIEELETHGRDLPEAICRRGRHVISENARVVEAAAALERRDAVEFGKLMDASHRSLRDDYEVSCEELDLMVELARNIPGVYGARMTGGGFGGCTVNLVAVEAVSEFKRQIAREYYRVTAIEPKIYVCRAEDGAHEVHSNSPSAAGRSPI